MDRDQLARRVSGSDPSSRPTRHRTAGSTSAPRSASGAVASAEALRMFSARCYPRARFIQGASRGILNAEMQITAHNVEQA
jgi:hypothetical protein